MLLRFVVYAALALLAGAAVAQPAPPAPPPQQAVLVITPDNLSYPFFGQLYAAFRDTLARETKTPVRLYLESLDLSTFGTPDQQRAAARWYAEKYANVKLDAVLVTGHTGLSFWLSAGLAPGVPVYFTTASAASVAAMALPPNVTGQMLRIDLAQTVRLARQLLPDTTTIALVGNRPEADQYRPFRAAELAALSQETQFIDLRGVAYETLLQKIANLPEHTVIYHTHLTMDDTGRSFEPRSVLANTVWLANRPTLIDIGSSLGLGALGGVVADPKQEGTLAGQRVAALLRGVAPASLPIVTEQLAARFDWRALQTWHIDSRRLPPGSSLQFYQPGPWEQYRLEIGLTLAALLVLLAMTIVLLIERRRRARAVAQSRERLAEVAHMNRNATASVFSAAIAHELNQPLAAILSNTEAAELMLAMPQAPLDEIRDILADIRRDDLRASDLIIRMRNLLKRSDADSTVADLNELIRQALVFIAAEARVRQAVIKTSMAPQPAWVLVDAVQIQQVLINLVINSLDAMAALAPSARRIAIASAVLDDKLVEVTVTDSGPGFAGHIERVFDSFFTTKSHGMGLGLSITATIIAAHGGTIAAENVRGGGACVRFRLPLHPPP